jgi:hypothetical protein
MLQRLVHGRALLMLMLGRNCRLRMCLLKRAPSMPTVDGCVRWTLAVRLAQPLSLGCSFLVLVKLRLVLVLLRLVALSMLSERPVAFWSMLTTSISTQAMSARRRSLHLVPSRLGPGATTIAVNKGGTGAVTLTGYVKGNGVSAFTASASIPNTDISGQHDVDAEC